MIVGVLAAGGWLAAMLAGAGTVLAWRLLSGRAELVARACHELRGPITAARLGLALGQRAGVLSADRLRAVDLELGRAALAIDDLAGAGFGRRSGPAAPGARTEFDLCELLADSVEAWRAAALVRGVELRLECPQVPLLVAGDRLRLAQATGNLIANALEHGADDVLVRARSANAAIRVEFIDGGPGLPAPVAELARRPRRGRGSRGRGLAIAVAVAASHGGRLAAAPSERGARLMLDLPARGARVASGTDGSGAGGSGGAPTQRPGG